MKIETHSDLATTEPLNSAATFRAELDKTEVSNESEETNTAESEESAHEPDDQGDLPDNTSSDVSNDSLDDDFDPRAPVPVSRLKKELAKRKVLEETVNQERTERIRAQTELDLYNRAFQQLQTSQQSQQQQNQNTFDPLDEEAHNYYKQNYVQKNELAEMQQELARVQAQLYQGQVSQTLGQQQSMFERSKPDFKDAYQHLFKAEIESAKWVAGNEQQATQMATSKLQNMAVMLTQQGKNVAEVFYHMSKSYGYSPKAKQTQSRSNLDAIETNMRKSKVADVPEASLVPGNGAANYTKRDNFEKVYSGLPNEREKNAEKFH